MVRLEAQPNGKAVRERSVSGLAVRLATEQDLEAIFRLLCMFHSESRFRVYEFDGKAVKESISHMLSQPSHNAIFLTERADAGPTGLLAVYAAPLLFAKATTAHALGFYVAPPYRGGASAAKLLIAFKRWGLSRGVNELTLHASADIDRHRFNRLMVHAGYQSGGKNYQQVLTGK